MRTNLQISNRDDLEVSPVFPVKIARNRPAPALTAIPQIRIPTYRLHRPSGKAVVTLGGRDVYLGTYGTASSKDTYKRLIAEFLASGGAPPISRDSQAGISLSELILRYWKWVKRDQTRTAESTIKPALRRLRQLYKGTLAADFGPLRLEAFRDSLLRESQDGKRLSRPYVNRLVKEVRRAFKWGVSKELVPPSVFQALSTIESIRYGRCDAPEPEPIRPVSDADIEAVIPFLSSVVADMVRVQRLTGMRPAEVCAMTTGQLEMSGDVWMYTPDHHKTKHIGKGRKVALGPKAQDVLRKYLRAIPDKPLFSPSDSVVEHKQRWRESAVTPITPSRRARDAKRARKPRRVFNDQFTPSNYSQAIRRACLAAGINCWAPNRLRHSRATEIRATMGLEAAGAVLGHAKLETTQIYAERQATLAAAVALKSG